LLRHRQEWERRLPRQPRAHPFVTSGPAPLRRYSENGFLSPRVFRRTFVVEREVCIIPQGDRTGKGMHHSGNCPVRTQLALLSLLALLPLLFPHAFPSLSLTQFPGDPPPESSPCPLSPEQRAHYPRMPFALEWPGPVLDTLDNSTLEKRRRSLP